jgi:hypothetical protein
MEIEKIWQATPDYNRLIAHFSADGLRRGGEASQAGDAEVVKDAAVQAEDS